MESKFVALELVDNELKWLRNFLADISLGVKPIPSVYIHCDCQATIAMAKNKSYNSKNRYIHLRHNVIKQLLRDRIISINFVKSEINLANHLIKHLGKKLINETSRGKRLLLIEKN